jgi:hypothetical protein
MKEAPGSSETSVITRATRRNNPEDTILHIPYQLDKNEKYSIQVRQKWKMPLINSTKPDGIAYKVDKS